MIIQFLRYAQPLPPPVSVALPRSLELTPIWHYTLVYHHRHSVISLIPTVLSRASVLPSGSHRCLSSVADTACYEGFHLLTYLLQLSV